VIDATIKEALESDVPVTTKIPARLSGVFGDFTTVRDVTSDSVSYAFTDLDNNVQ
jgi:hypothetical protein